MNRLLILVMLVSALTCYKPSFCRTSYGKQSTRQQDGLLTQIRDTLPKKKFVRGTGELMLAEMTPWLLDQYIRKVDYTHISFHTLAYNIKLSNWAWDNDPFAENQFAHPFHGSLFFNALRDNGFTFWQSVPASFVGSYLWETVAENQAPSPNDFINTSFGGVTLGEMTHRLADRLVNNRSTGLGKQVSEVVAFFINPVNGFNRVVDGKWGRRAYSASQRDSTPIYTEIDLGVRQYQVNGTNGAFDLYGHAKLVYGSPFGNYNTPFGYMYINTEFGKDQSALINLVSVYGSLMGRILQSTGKVRQVAILTANYDFIQNEAIFYSSQNIKLNLFSTFNLADKIKVNTSLAGGVVVLAAVPDVYFADSVRNYDYCSGSAFNANAGIAIGDKFFYTVSYKGAWLKTVNGSQSNYLLHTITSELRYMIVPGLSVCAEPGYFSLLGRYRNFPHVNKTYPYLRISTRYSFNL